MRASCGSTTPSRSKKSCSPNPEVADLPPDAYEVIGEKVTYRLAQRPGAYVILKYRRPVIKRKDTEVLSCPPAPPAVFEKSFADVSVLGGTPD